MKAAFAVLLLLACAGAAVASRELQQASNAAVLTLQFDNSKSEVESKNKMPTIVETIANYVFKVPVANVKLEGVLDQSGVVTDQAVATFRGTGPTTNGKAVLENCQQNVREDLLGLGSSVAQREIKKATDTYWPNDAIKVQKASCKAV